MKHVGLLKILPLLIACLVALPAQAALIDLNDFFADPSVTVAADGSSATMEEDAAFSVVLLANDPGLGDPAVVIASPGKALFFHYDFVEGAGSDDEFGAFVLDSTGVSAGPAFEFFTQDSSMGNKKFNLSSLTGEPFIGLQFQLTALPGDGDLDSVVTISNVQLVTVPEPATALLLVVGVLGLVVYRRRAR